MIRATAYAMLCAVAIAGAPAVVAQGFSLPGFGQTSTQADEVLQKVVIISRNGVNAPAASTAVLANWAALPWPDWGQPPASLSLRGARLAFLMGRFYREYVGTNQLMPTAGCPSPGSVFMYADTQERTQDTARALVAGFAGDCGIDIRVRAGSTLDPLFHPLAAGVCRIDPMTAQTRVLERVGGDLNRTARDLKPSYGALQAMLDCCRPALCSALGRGDRCELSDLPTAMVPQADGSGLSLIGALPIAATSSELLLLEYANNMPAGWGRATPALIRDAMRLHSEEFDLLQRTPYLARRKGSALLSKIAAAVTSARSLGFGPIDPAVRDAKFIAYVGHDTNLWNLAGMLNVTWSQPGYQRNQTPPAGALAFEVRETKDKKLVVYSSYVAQSMEQMRNATALTLELPPVRTPLRLPGCSTDKPGFPCTIEEFAVAVRNSIDRDCVE